MRQTLERVFETWVFHWTPSFHKWKALSNYFRADWYKTKKNGIYKYDSFLCFISVSLGVRIWLFESGLCWLFWLPFIRFPEEVGQNLHLKEVAWCFSWASELSLLNVAFQIRRIKKNCSKKQQQQTCRVWVPRRSWCRRRNLRSIPPRFRSSDH